MLISNFQDYAFIGLGSNLGSAFGSPRENVLEAVKKLEKLSDEPVIVSGLHETTPLNCPPGSPNFINAVLALLPRQDEVPQSFLEALQRIENSMGRVRSGLLNEARIIDLDLLLFREENIDTEILMLPHPAMLDRKFVMEPLTEIMDQGGITSIRNFAKKNSAVKRS